MRLFQCYKKQTKFMLRIFENTIASTRKVLAKITFTYECILSKTQQQLFFHCRGGFITSDMTVYHRLKSLIIAFIYRIYLILEKILYRSQPLDQKILSIDTIQCTKKQFEFMHRIFGNTIASTKKVLLSLCMK